MKSNPPHKIFGIIGCSLEYSLSPTIHNHLFRQFSLNHIYTTREIHEGELRKAVEGVRALGIGGVNVTYPFKESIIPLLDKLAASAKRTGAVNTIKNTRGKLTGYNTDLFGIRATIADKLQLRLQGQEVLLLGAGGAARACLVELLRWRVGRILICNRSVKKAKKIARDFSTHTKQQPIDVLPLDRLKTSSIDIHPVLIINATSAGPAEVKKIIRLLSQRCDLRGSILWDMNYGRRALKPNALPPGPEYVDGLYMLAAQAVESLRIWTGRQLEPGTIYDLLLTSAKE